MVSIQVTGGPVPQATLHDALDWGRVVVATLARGVVATLLGLALWAAAPAVIGWLPTSVMTGSMEPRLHPGDVVVSRPVAPVELRPGRILLADDPDQPGRLRMHRYLEDGPRDTIITKGDANPQADSTPLRRTAVHGVAFLRVPYVGSPVVWLRNGEWARVAVLALGIVGLLALCTVDGSLRRLAAEDDADEPDDDPRADAGAGPVGGHTDRRAVAHRGRTTVRRRAGREARHRAATGLPSDASAPSAAATTAAGPAVSGSAALSSTVGPSTALSSTVGPSTALSSAVRRSAAHRSSSSRSSSSLSSSSRSAAHRVAVGHGRRAVRADGYRGRAGMATVLVLGLVTAGALVPAPAGAVPWSGKSTRTATFAAVTPTVPALNCTTVGNTAVLSWPGGDDPNSYDVLVGSTVLVTVAGNLRTTTLGGGAGLSLGGTSTVTVRANYGSSVWDRTSAGVGVKTFTVLGIGSAAACA